MIVSLTGLADNVSPQFISAENAQASAENTGNKALAQAVVSLINAAGYHAHMEEACGVSSWLAPACNYNIRVTEAPDLDTGVGGSDYQTRQSGELAHAILSQITLLTKGAFVDSGSGTSTDQGGGGTVGARFATASKRPDTTSRTGATSSRTGSSRVSVVEKPYITPAPQSALEKMQQVDLGSNTFVQSSGVGQWISDNALLLVAGGAALFFFMGRGK